MQSKSMSFGTCELIMENFGHLSNYAVYLFERKLNLLMINNSYHSYPHITMHYWIINAIFFLLNKTKNKGRLALVISSPYITRFSTNVTISSYHLLYRIHCVGGNNFPKMTFSLYSLPEGKEKKYEKLKFESDYVK